MSDPAVEAAQRAWDETNGFGFDSLPGAMADAAREALAPIRELHRPGRVTTRIPRVTGGTVRYTACITCTGDDGHPALWPCPTARLVYAEVELCPRDHIVYEEETL